MFDDIDKINKLRYLRKEKEDLLMYIKKQFLKYDLNSEDLKKDIGEFDSLIEDINKKFDFYMSII